MESAAAGSGDETDRGPGGRVQQQPGNFDEVQRSETARSESMARDSTRDVPGATGAGRGLASAGSSRSRPAIPAGRRPVRASDLRSNRARWEAGTSPGAGRSRHGARANARMSRARRCGHEPGPLHPRRSYRCRRASAIRIRAEARQATPNSQLPTESCLRIERA